MIARSERITGPVPMTCLRLFRTSLIRLTAALRTIIPAALAITAAALAITAAALRIIPAAPSYLWRCPQSTLRWVSLENSLHVELTI